MPKKNKKSKKIENEPIEDTSVADDHLTEPVAAEEDAAASNPTTEQTDMTSVGDQVLSTEESIADASPEHSGEDESADDLLDDVRRSLIEDATHTEEKQTKWWKKIGKGSRKEKADAAKVEPVEITPPPVVEAPTPIIEDVPIESEPDPIDELIEMLEHEAVQDTEKITVPKTEEVAPEPEEPIDVGELKKQAFSHRDAENNEDISEVRAIALGGDEEVFVEVEATRQDPVEERLTAFENALRPYRTYINLTIAFLGIVMAVIASILLFNLYRASVPAKPAEVSNLPYPTAVSLPGGWRFQLEKGSLVDGQWNPRGAEWLQGTEVCRWVALPWSRQLEAVVRTLNPKDPIELVMSNQDKLVYEVYALHQMSPEEMQELDSNSPCLLIVLAEPDSETRWVLTALP